MNFNIKRTIKYENFIIIQNDYKNDLHKQNYKNSTNSFNEYISTINNLCTYKKKKKDKRKYLSFMNDYENLIKLKRNVLFENLNFDKKNFCKSFPFLTFFLYNVLVKIWTNEKILKNDVENLSGQDRPFFFKLIKMKFKIEINISDLKIFLKDLNTLRNLKIEKRNEEYLKFIGRDFMNFLNDIFCLNELRKIFVKKIGVKKYKFFYVEKKNKIFLKKFTPELKKFFLENEIFKNYFFSFKNKFIERKKNLIKIFFKNLMTIIGNMYKNFKTQIKNYENSSDSPEKAFEKCFEQKYPWTLNQINSALDYFEKI